MARRVVWEVSHAARAADQPQKTDDLLDKIANYIPGEVVALWTAATAILPTLTPGSEGIALWILAAVGLVLTPLYVMARIRKEDAALNRLDESFPFNEVILSTVSFAFWVFAIGGPFAEFTWYSPGWGAFALVIWSAISGLIPKLA
jgi:hypothetical protein